ncbi:MAG: dicarboxylate/amino acid:cation symporter [Hyphomonadaceae bacterium]
MLLIGGRMVKSLSLFVLLGLVAGLAAGAAIQSSGDANLTEAAGVLEAFGGLWLNALRMTVVPLVVALLINGVASVSDAARAGGLVARFVLLFSVLLFLAAAYAIGATEALLGLWPVERGAAEAFIAGAGGTTAIEEAPSFAAWLQGLAPSNPVRAAAEDAMVPLVVFALFFGFAATRLASEARTLVVDFFRAIADTMVIIVHWVLLAGPIGVFCLSLGVGLRAGFGAAGVLVQYIVIVTAVLAGITLIGMLLAVTLGRQPLGRYIAATTPVWAIAASTQSSIASLPAMLEACRLGLGLPERVTNVILPLAVAVFRFTSPVGNLGVVLFIAHLYGIELNAMQIVGGVVVAYGVSIGAVGLPGQVSFVASIAPICLAMGVPIDLLGILIAVEIFPDIVRTLGNCAGDIAATAMLSDKKETAPQGAAPSVPAD